MKKMKQTTALLLSLVLLAALLSGCGGSYSTSSAGGPMSYSGNTSAASDAPGETAMESGWAQELADSSSGGVLPANVKMIYRADIALESTEFDAAAQQLAQLVRETGGWFESSQLNNSNQRYRRAYYTVRVPAENFDSFCSRVGDMCKINSISRSAEDVSERYYDMESRLATQRTKLERLQALLAQAEDMEDIITLETAISETELAIENLTGSLRHYDSLVGYSTIDITLAEVYQITETEEPAIGFGAKLSAAFRSGSNSFVYGVQDLLLGFARGWAGWLIFLAIVAAVILVIARLHRRSAERAAGELPPWKQKKRRRGRKAAETRPDTAAEANRDDQE